MAREARVAKREHAALVRRLERQAEEQRKAEEERRKAEATERRQAEAEAAERRKAEATEQRKALGAAAKAQQKALEAAAKTQKKSLEAEAAARQEAMERHAEVVRRLDLRFKREQAERDRALDRRFNQAAGEVDNRWGALAEGLVEQDLLDLLRNAGRDVLSVSTLRPIKRGGETREYDLLACGVHDTVVVEVKSTLRRRDVTQFRKRLRDFRTWCPEHARDRVLGAMACLKAEETALEAAEAAGFYVIRALDAKARILNAEDFRPTIY